MSSMWLARRVRSATILLRASTARTLTSCPASVSNGYALRSAVWIPTEKEVPTDAAIPSHQLLIRGGFIRKSGHGVFTFLPLGKRVVGKLEAIIDEEMARINGNKIDLPLMIPAELWQQSGRWQTRGPELITFADRRDALHALAPTHEESITSLVAHHFNYNNSAHGANASLRLYQVGKKFRDEIRPRFGLLRAREFVMKDMYSFDTSFDRALETYEDVVRAYEAILKTRLKLPIAKVEADSGSIGGNLSHEFHVVADIGEDAILSCASEKCGYAANVEKALGVLPSGIAAGSEATSADVNEVLSQIQAHIDAEDVNAWKSLVAIASESSALTCKVLRERQTSTSESQDDTAPLHWALVFARKDREVNELSLKSFFGGEELEEVSFAALDAHEFKVQEDAGQLQLSVFIDDSLQQDRLEANPLAQFLWSSAQKHADKRLVKLECGHFRMAQEGDGCPRCPQSKLEAKRGIEVGHVFYLGKKYSKPFNVTFIDHDEKNKKPVKKVMEMGCFGMGVTRLIASAVEVSHDAHGIVWPTAIAPYKVIVMAIGSKSGDEPISQKAIEIAQELASGVIGPALHKSDVILDDRWRESPGSKLAESELLGYPFRVVVGKRFANEGLVEVQARATLEKTFLSPSELTSFFAEKAAQGEL